MSFLGTVMSSLSLFHWNVQTLPPKQTNLPPELFSMKEMPSGGEEEEEEEKNKTVDAVTEDDVDVVQSAETTSSQHSSEDRDETQTHRPNG